MTDILKLEKHVDQNQNLREEVFEAIRKYKHQLQLMKLELHKGKNVEAEKIENFKSQMDQLYEKVVDNSLIKEADILNQEFMTTAMFAHFLRQESLLAFGDSIFPKNTTAESYLIAVCDFTKENCKKNQ